MIRSVTIGVVVLSAMPVFAHHGAGTFDLSRTVSFTGAQLTKVEF